MKEQKLTPEQKEDLKEMLFMALYALLDGKTSKKQKIEAKQMIIAEINAIEI